MSIIFTLTKNIANVILRKTNEKRALIMKTDNLFYAFDRIIYYRLPRWNMYILIAFLLTSAAIAVLLFKSRLSVKKKIYSAILYVYSYNVLITTLFMRDKSDKRYFKLIPFTAIYNLIKEPKVINNWELIFNTLLFVPIGLLLPCVFEKCKRFRTTLLVGFCTTLIIETIQIAAKIGVFETDDIITNTLGAVIGFGIYKVIHNRKLSHRN